MNFGNMTSEQTLEVAREAIANLTDDEVYALILELVKNHSWFKDELLAELTAE